MSTTPSSLNWKEIDLIVEELKPVDSHIQKIQQPDYHSIIFEHYRPGQRFSLYISLEQGKTRLHRLTRKIKTGIKTQRFVQFLRSRILGGRIIECGQIAGERIVKLTVQRAGEVTILWIRLWGGAPNIIATDVEGTILDAFYRRPKRGETSGGFFHPENDPSLLPPKRESKRQFEIRTIEGEGSFNEKIENLFFSTENEEQFRRLREEILDLIDDKVAKLENIGRDLNQRRDNYEQHEKFKQYGDLITSMMHTIHKGDRSLEAVDYSRDNTTILIDLDPTLSPAENAAAYYKKYKRAKSGLRTITHEISTIEKQIEAGRIEKEKVKETDDRDYLFQIKKRYSKELSSAQRSGIKREIPGVSFRSGGFTILVGRNARENDELLRNHVRGNDYWLHTRDYPGGYVFIKAQSGKSVPPHILLDAATLAIHYSKKKGEDATDLYYTQVKYLRRAKDGKRGLVIPTQEKNVTATLDRERLQRLFERNESNENS